MGTGFGVLSTKLRGYRYANSGLRVENFGVLSSGNQKKPRANKGLRAIVEGVTLLNTESNFNNTGFSEEGKRAGQSEPWSVGKE